MRKSGSPCEQRCLQRLSTIGFLLLAILVASTCTYEESTRVEIDKTTPLTFRLHGSGYQVTFVVSEIHPSNQVLPAYRNPGKNIDLWEIEPADGTSIRAWDWPPITYGKIPLGFKQRKPASGDAPPLTTGKTYAAGGEAYGANGGEVWFTIKDGIVTEVQKPGGF